MSNSLPEKHKESIEDMMNRIVIEELAKLEHDQWVTWAKSLMEHEKLSEERKQRWLKLFCPYKDLTEEQKEQDRVWARKVLAVLGLDNKEVMRSLVGAQIYGVNIL
jgi:hypothetical protein